MLKKQALRKITVATLALLIVFLISLFPSSKSDFNTIVNYEKGKTLPVYAIDDSNYVARSNIYNSNNDTIKYLISVLTIGSQEANYLPTFLKPIIPMGTKLVDYSLENGLLKLNFSEELLNISIENEEKMLESLVYSLSEIENVNQIIIYVNNKILNEFPNSHKKINFPLDKNIGINKEYTINEIKDTQMTTIYYHKKYEDTFYYVPISKISNDDGSKIEIIVKELKSVPTYQTNLISFLNAAYELASYEILDNQIMVSFNNNTIAGLKDDELLEEVRYTLSLSIRDTFLIDNIIINID